jgi:hypothetical protein
MTEKLPDVDGMKGLLNVVVDCLSAGHVDALAKHLDDLVKTDSLPRNRI